MANNSENIAIVERLLKKNGYEDLGYAPELSNITINGEGRVNPIRMLDCSPVNYRQSNIVYIDDDRKQILRVNLSID